MKKFLVCLLSAVMMVSLAACTPTKVEDQKQEETTMPQTTEAFKADTMEIRNSGNEDLPEMATVSIYRISKNRIGLIQEMDGLETEELEAQGIIDLLISYGVLEEGTQMISFEQTDDRAVLNLNQITSQEDAKEIRLVVESLVNTFTENYELEGGLILQENGSIYTIDSVPAEEDGSMFYNDEYRKLD